jgi:hypothetical protein
MRARENVNAAVGTRITADEAGNGWSLKACCLLNHNADPVRRLKTEDVQRQHKKIL